MAQQHTPAAGSGIDKSAVRALRDRAITGLLINASDSAASAGEVGFSFWRGYIHALQDLSTGAGNAAAAKDKRSSGYEPPSHLQRAFAALPVRIEAFTLAQVQQFLAAQGVEVAADSVSNGDVDTSQQFKDSVGVPVHLHYEHTAAVVDGDYGALHGDSSVRVTVAQEGSAA